MRQEWRTDYSSLLDPYADRPSPSDLAGDNPGDGPGYDPDERAALVAQVVELQATAARYTRCDTCQTSVDLEWDGELCPHGQPLCAGCYCRCGGDAA